MLLACVAAGLFCALVVRSSDASAQTRPELFPAPTLAAEVASSADVAEVAQRERLAHRAGYRIAMGVGLLAASVVHLALFGRRGACEEGRLMTPWLTAPVFAIGGGVLIGTGIPDVHAARGSRRGRDVAQKVFASLGAGLLASGVMFGISAREWVSCMQR